MVKDAVADLSEKRAGPAENAPRTNPTSKLSTAPSTKAPEQKEAAREQAQEAEQAQEEEVLPPWEEAPSSPIIKTAPSKNADAIPQAVKEAVPEATETTATHAPAIPPTSTVSKSSTDPFEPDYRLFEENQSAEALPAGFWDSPVELPDTTDSKQSGIDNTIAELPTTEESAPVTEQRQRVAGNAVEQHPLFPQLQNLFPGELLSWEEQRTEQAQTALQDDDENLDPLDFEDDDD